MIRPLLFALAAVAAPGDPRIELVELQLARQNERTLAAADALVHRDPAAARRYGVQYLRGHVLDVLGRTPAAIEAFAATMNDTPLLEPYARYRMALAEERLGHPEVAAGLVATLLGRRTPTTLVPAGMRLLRRSLRRGGDCRLLRGLPPARFPSAERRQLVLAQAECAARSEREDVVVRLLAALLVEDTADLAARDATDLLTPLVTPNGDRATVARLGLSLYEHRDFARADPYLRAALRAPPAGQRDELAYALARSAFWQEDYAGAASQFADLARRSAGAEARARAFFQEGRARELAGDWRGAIAAFDRAHRSGVTTSWGAPALLAQLRLELRSGDETAALGHYSALARRPQWSEHAAAAAIFLAASDIVRDQGRRAARWLFVAESGRARHPSEIAYWRGRLAELQGSRELAVGAYARAVRLAPHHPFAGEARRRLARPTLAEAAHRAGGLLASSGRAEDLHAAWILLGDGDRRGAAAREALRRRLLRDERNRDYLAAEVVAAAQWPLWEGGSGSAEELLLGLAIPVDTAAVLRHFPVTHPSLALTGSRLLARTGDVRRSLLVAEILAERRPSGLPPALLPPAYRQQLHPLPYGYLIHRETRRRGVDPHLLAAILREESRFDPLATSPAAARGLAQMTIGTAERLAGAAGVGRIGTGDLYRPEVAIALGATYLGELLGRLGAEPQVIAAYNAGEPQARLWRSHCFSNETAEYLSKVSFDETRAYLERVLTSRSQYGEIYGDGAAPP